MEKLYYISLLFLNFAILNILLSFIFFLLSLAGKFLISSPHIKSRLFFISLLSPPVISGFMIISSFAPPFFIKIPGKAMFCLNEPYCYIFSFIPTETPLFNGLLMSAILLVLIPLLYAVTGIRNYRKAHENVMRFRNKNGITGASFNETSLSDYSTKANEDWQTRCLVENIEKVHRIKVKIIDTPYLFSFIWGYISNTLVISTGVLKNLTGGELRGLLSHELSHYKRRDNILKGILLICRNSLYIFPNVHYLFNWWKEEIELIGDEWAARLTGQPLDVASALIKMKKHAPYNTGLHLPSYTTGFSLYNRNGIFTQRVERLITINDSLRIPAITKTRPVFSEVGLLAGIVFLFPALFMAIYELDPLLVHCYLERILS